MTVTEIYHNTWKVACIGTIKYVFVVGLYIDNKPQYIVKIKSFNGKEIRLKDFNSEVSARNFAERFIAMLEEQE